MSIIPPARAEAKPSALRAFGAHRIARHGEGRIDTRRRRSLKDIARTLPRAPGVYFFYGVDDRLLYIGKAKSLRDRVRSYFGETKQNRPAKLRRLLAEIERLEWQPCGSELEALLVERRLIAELRPILNHQHNRFDVYPYLLLSDEAFPRLTLTRAEPVEIADCGLRIAEKESSHARHALGEDTAAESDDLFDVPADLDHLAAPDSNPQSAIRNPQYEAPRAGELPGLYLGPFTTPRAAWWTLEAVRALFPLRACEGELKIDVNGRGCFYREIGRCCGPCVGDIDKTDYAQLCADLVALLQTGQAPQLDALRARMARLADEWRFEEAAKLREQLHAIEIVAARLRRLQRMREDNNVIIVQPALDGDEGRISGESSAARQSTLSPTSITLFFVQGGLVRRRVVVCDESEWENVKATIQNDFATPPPAAMFTAKTELDEMMILDRWLQAHGSEGCCAWMNERPSRQWAANAMRKLRKWTRAQNQFKV